MLLPTLFWAFATQAQSTTISPYSYFGIGEEISQNTNELKSMGALGVYADSLHINMGNPASLSHLQQATFAMGGSMRFNELKTENKSYKGKSGAFDYLALALPLNKFALSVGIASYASTGYTLVTKESIPPIVITNRLNGDGGVYRAFLAGSYRITEALSIGAEGSYLFGEETHGTTKLVADDGNGFNSITGTQFAKKHTIRGFKTNVGVHYLKTLESGQQIYISGTFEPQYQLNNHYDYKIQTVKELLGEYLPIQTKDVASGSQTWKMPYAYEVGVGYGQKNVWFIGASYRLADKQTMNDGFSYKRATYENQTRWSLGGYVTPRYNSFTSYFNRMTYRVGLNYETTGLVVDQKSVKDQSVHLGVGFPVGRYVSNVNVGVAYGKKGTSSVLLQNYIQLSVGFSLNDIWFRKRKFD